MSIFKRLILIPAIIITCFHQQHVHHGQYSQQSILIINAFSVSYTTTITTPSTVGSHNSNKNRIRMTQVNEENTDSSSSSSSSSSSNSSKDSKNKQDVDNLFATYMAQRKDKGFMDTKYNLGRGAGSGSDSTEDDVNNVDMESSSSTVSGSSDVGDGITSAGGDGSSNDNEGEITESQTSRLRSRIPGIRRFMSSSSTNSNEDKVVQHIQLGGNGNGNGSGSTNNSGGNNNDNENTKESSSSSSQNIDSSTAPPNPPSLLEADISRINTNYKKFHNQMKDQLETLKQENPDSVPENADEILRQVIEEQRMYDMKEVKESRMMENFEDYYENAVKKEKLLLEIMEEANDDNTYGSGAGTGAGNGSESIDGTGSTQYPIVNEIVEEANRGQKLRLEQEEQYRQFQEYEQSLKNELKSSTSSSSTTPSTSSSSSSSTNIDSDSNFDEIQLELLQDLLQKRQQRSEMNGIIDDEDLYLTDNIEDGIEELQTKIDNQEYDSKLYKPESIKEWQMYRAIATKLASEKDQNSDDNDDEDGEGGNLGYDINANSGSLDQGRMLVDNMTEEDDITVRKKVEAWKEFQIKEEEMRKEAGLAIQYRPPFEWNDQPEPEDELTLRSKPKVPFDRVKAEEARSELDQLALQVLNDLMNKTIDEKRREKIRSEIEELKVGIQAREEAMKNVKSEVEVKKVVKPININSALGRGSKAPPKEKTSEEDSETDDTSLQSDESGIIQEDEEDDFEDEYFVDEDEEQPPDSPFFRDIDEESELEKLKTIDEIVASEEAAMEDDEVVINLGTMEEQKFRSMVVRSGVRTKEGENKLKEEWEEFQRVEQMMRDKSGLTDAVEAKIAEAVPGSKFDVNNIFKDGDIDADAILGTIGKRPSRKNRDAKKVKQDTSPKVVEETIQITEKVDAVVNGGDDIDMKPTEKLSDEKVDDTKGIDNDAEPITKQETVPPESVPNRGSLGFGEEFAPQKQFSGFNERKADLLEYNVISVAQLNTLMGLKASVYSTGVSPYLARVNKPFQDFGAIFMLEGVLVDVTGLQFQAWKRTARTYDFKIPTLEDTKYASVHSDEYAVQKIFYWTDDIFALRKVVETFKEKRDEVFQEWIIDKNLNPNSGNDSPSSSPVLGIYDSEENSDVERDVMNLQLSAWRKAAREHGFESPTIDIVNIVGSMDPDEAIRAVFRWTDDFMLSNNVAAAYRKYLREETSVWMKQDTQSKLQSNQLPASSSQPPESSPISETMPKTKATKITNINPTMEDYLQLKLRAWENVAQKHNYIPPSLSQVNVAEFSGPEKAVTNIFQWTKSSIKDTEIDGNEECSTSVIVASYRDALKDLTQEWINFSSSTVTTAAIEEEEEEEEESIPLLIVRDGADKWLSSMQEVYVPSVLISSMNEELTNGILEETGLAKYFTTDKRIDSSNNKYETDIQRILGGSLRAERRPDHCVVFSSTPHSASITHEVEMKNIALVSPYPYYELTNADMTVRDFSSIAMMNMRNVFSETPSEEPMEQIQVESPRVQRKTLLKTRFWDDD